MLLRNLAKRYDGKLVLGSPYVGILAAQIAVETAEGDHDEGILYNEAMDPEYAGKYLRAWVTNPPAVGRLFVAQNGAVGAEDLPAGIHIFNYKLDVDDIYDSTSYFEVRVGVVDATAPGATLTGTASISPGVATGEVNATADGVTLTGTASIEPGTASGGQSATAPGVILTGSAEIDPGSAQGASVGTAPGVTLTGTASLEPGSATGNQAATAPGVTLTGSASLTPGAAVAVNPDATAPGVVLTGSSSIIPGSASNSAHPVGVELATNVMRLWPLATSTRRVTSLSTGVRHVG